MSARITEAQRVERNIVSTANKAELVKLMEEQNISVQGFSKLLTVVTERSVSVSAIEVWLRSHETHPNISPCPRWPIDILKRVIAEAHSGDTKANTLLHEAKRQKLGRPRQAKPEGPP